MSADAYELERGVARLVGSSAFAEPPLVGYREGAGAGWVFSRACSIRRLFGVVGGELVEAEYGIERPDVAARFGDEPNARAAGFRGAAAGEIWAELSTGRRVRCFAAAASSAGSPIARGRRWLDEATFGAARGGLRAVLAARLTRACGDEFPTVAREADAIFDALEADARLRPAGLRDLRRLLDDRPLPPRELFKEAGARSENFPPPEFSAASTRGEKSSMEKSAVSTRGENFSTKKSTGITRGENFSVPEFSASARSRILFVAGLFPSEAHGGGLRLFDLVRGLAARHDLDLYAFYRDPLDRASLLRLLPSLRAARLVHSEALDPADARAWLRRLGRAPGDYRAAHFDWPSAAPLIRPLAPFARTTLFTLVECVTRRGALDLARALAGDRAALGAAARAFVEQYAQERAALAAAGRAIAVTDGDADFAARAFAVPRPAVIPTCVAEELFLPPEPPGAPRDRSATFIGYFDHYANRDALAWYLTRVHPLICARLPDYRLRVVGRGLRPGADARVDWIGAVDELGPALRGGRVGLAPLVSGAGIRGKINQYSAVGRPTVATPLAADGLPYLDGESILLARDPGAFAAAVVRLLVDDALWLRVRDRARRVCEENFRWPAALARLEALHDG